jgi:predicted lipase
MKIFTLIEHYFEKFNANDIFITGHSLGGALATLFYSLYLSYVKTIDSYNKNIHHISFGSPRVGNHEFSKYIKSKRIINGVDIICMLPLPIGYRHINYKNLLNKKIFPPFSMEDHYINEYYNSLKKELTIS